MLPLRYGLLLALVRHVLDNLIAQAIFHGLHRVHEAVEISVLFDHFQRVPGMLAGRRRRR